MTKSAILLVSLLLTTGAFIHAQSNDYWQQEVNYKIRAELNDQSHTLDGNIQITYVNNSPDQLTHLYFHLWPNAYENLNTAFAQQKFEDGDTEFYFSEPEERGSITNLDFMVGDEDVRWHLDSTHVDICKIYLNEPLHPGDSIIITTPFKVDIPKSFSRLGHTEQSYQLTQWYPKPAVYDENGWHPMPYLDQGEFYSEFGTFDVFITVPENYVVAATGNLKTESERDWLRKKARETAQIEEFDGEADTFPTSSSQTKTLHYHQENVHDFAWFADKRYHVLRDSVELPSGKTVTTWAYFTDFQADLWQDATEYLQESTYHYSKWVGTYPYNNVSAVQGALSAGAGMEYPTITIIGEAQSPQLLDNVITHEVGHNWFYGILGFNERRWPWMDEGINSYYENRYMDMKYPNASLLPGLEEIKPVADALDLSHFDNYDRNHLFYQFMARRNMHQPLNLPAPDYSSFANYGAMVYMKTAVALRHLATYLGQDTFDRIMQAFYEKWQFKHPDPSDLQRAFTSRTDKDLGWFFNDLLTTNKQINYAIADVEEGAGRLAVKVRNKGGINAPYPISGVKNDSAVVTKWYEGHEQVDQITFPDGDFDKLRIDHHHVTLEYNRGDNTYKLDALANKWEPLRFQPLASIENPYRSQLFIMPSLAWNNYDKTSIGLTFTNSFLPPKRFQYFLAPMFGTASKTLTGMGKLNYTFLPDDVFRTIDLSLYAERFSYLINWRNGADFFGYTKLEPSLSLRFDKNDPRSNITKTLTFRSHLIRQELPYYPENAFTEEPSKKNQDYYINETSFSFQNNRPINPFSLDVLLEQGRNFLKTSFEYKYQLTYDEQDEGLHIRVFGGAFIDHTIPDDELKLVNFQLNPSAGTGQFQKDYKFEEPYLGRSATGNFFSQQISKKEGGFRSITSVGQRDDWLVALNVNSTVPIPVPIRPFAGLGMFPTTVKNDNGNEEEEIDFAYELGGTIILIPNALEINFPVWTSEQIRDNHTAIERDKYYEKISFLLNLRVLDLIENMDDLPLSLP